MKKFCCIVNILFVGMLFHTATAQSSSSKYTQLQASIDSLLYKDVKQVLPLITLHEDYAISDGDTLQLMKALINRGDYYYESNDIPSSTQSYLEATRYTNPGNDFDELRCHGYAYAAYNLTEIELFERSRDVAFSALKYSKLITDSSYLADCYSIIGATYFKTLDFEQSAIYFDSCLIVEKKLKDASGTLKALNNLGRLNVSNGLLQNALLFYQEALELSISINPNSSNSAVIMSNLSDVYQDLGDLDLASSWLNKAIAILQNSDNYSLICADYISLIRLYQKQGKNELASITIDKLGSNISNCNNSTRVDYLLEKSKLYSIAKDFNACTKVLLEAEQFVKENQVNSREASVLQAQYELYKTIGENAKAIEANELLIALEKKRSEIEKTQKIAEVNARFELDKKIQQITNLQDQQNIKDTEITTLQKRFWIILILAFGAISFLTYIYLSRSKKQKKLISAQKSKIDRLSIELESIRSTIKRNVESGYRYQGKAPDLDTINTIIKTPLTPREYDILTALFEGKSNKEIAADLFLSINTVKFHLKNIYDKLEVKNRIQAMKTITR